MSYSVQFVRGGSVIYSFPAAAFVQPQHDYTFNDAQPPLPTAVNKAWTIEGILAGTSEVSTETLWTDLVAILENPAAYPDGVQLLQGVSVIEEISFAAGYDLVKVEQITSPRSVKPELQWHSEMRFAVRVSGRRRLVNVTRLEQHDSFAYDEAGLLTRTLAGTVETKSGTSAKGQAATFGLSLPGPAYGFLTNGPGGVNVEQLDAADTKATFVSSYQQTGQALPAGVGPSFSVSLESTTTSGELITVTTVSARGPGAMAAVSAKAPAGAIFSRVVKSDAWGLTATGIFVTKQLATPGRLLMLWTFDVTGGGPGAGSTERTGQRPPALHVLPLSVVEIVETISIDVVGAPQDGDFLIPAPLAIEGVIEDQGPGKRRTAGPRCVQFGTTHAGDRWTFAVTRTYLAAEMPDLPTVIGQQVLRPDSLAGQITPSVELKRGAKGSSKSGPSTTDRGGFEGTVRLGIL